MNIVVSILLILGKIDVDTGGEIGMEYQEDFDTVFTFNDMDIDRASVEVEADLFENCEAKIEVDFADGVELKNARLRYDPVDYFSVRVGRQKMPVSREEMTSYYQRAFLAHTQGNQSADDDDYVGRGIGLILKGKIPLGDSFKIEPFVSVFDSPVDDGVIRGVSRLEISWGKHQLAAGYSSRENLFNADSLMWNADLHIHAPVSCDAELMLTPFMQSYSVQLQASFWEDRIKPAVRYELYAEESESPENELALALAWDFKERVKIQTDLYVPLDQQNQDDLRMLAGLKVKF